MMKGVPSATGVNLFETGSGDAVLPVSAITVTVLA
jgi:hypothetical protein